MARYPENHPPPCQVNAPEALVPLMQVFQVESEIAAKSLLYQAAQAIFGEEDLLGGGGPTKEEIEVVFDLIRGLKPSDTVETLYAAQIVSSHLLGMRRLASTYESDQRLGLKLLRFSNEALGELERKRNGRSQNITVNYHHSGTGNQVSQTVISEETHAGKKC